MKIALKNEQIKLVEALELGDIIVLQDPVFGTQGHIVIRNALGVYSVLNLDTNVLWLEKFDSLKQIVDSVNMRITNRRELKLVKIIGVKNAEVREIV